MEHPEAKIAICKCSIRKKEFGVRFEKDGSNWKATWAFEMKKEGSAKREGYDKTRLKGMISHSENYPGCPFCKGKHFVICQCGGLSCFSEETKREFTCGWCGLSGTLSEYDGDGFSAGGDR